MLERVGRCTLPPPGGGAASVKWRGSSLPTAWVCWLARPGETAGARSGQYRPWKICRPDGRPN